MDSTTTHAGGYVSVPAIVPTKRPEPPRTPNVELLGIVRSKFGKQGTLLVAFGDGRFQWSVTCKPADLQSFARFQAVVAEQRDLWISHSSQQETRAAQRREDWDYSVRAAYERGGRT